MTVSREKLTRKITENWNAGVGDWIVIQNDSWNGIWNVWKNATCDNLGVLVDWSGDRDATTWTWNAGAWNRKAILIWHAALRTWNVIVARS